MQAVAPDGTVTCQNLTTNATTATTAGTITGKITGSQITGAITTATVPGSQLTGAITTATLPGSQLTGPLTYPDGSQTMAGATCGGEGDVAVVHSGKWVCRSALPHYVDNGDGTVTDNVTGLMWEKKLASSDASCLSGTQSSRNVRCVQNLYVWSATVPNPDGTLYSDFLAKINLNSSLAGNTACFANRCDWRIPTIVEVQGILLAPNPNCPSSPCIDATFGPTQASGYWSSSSSASSPNSAWYVSFADGTVDFITKSPVFVGFYARAVRGGR